MHFNSFKIRRQLLGVAISFLALSSLALVTRAQGVDINDTRLLSQPAISKDHIAFIYAGDLWLADLDGRNVKRLTADDGQEGDRTQQRPSKITPERARETRLQE